MKDFIDSAMSAMFWFAIGYGACYFFGAFLHDLIGTLLKVKKDDPK